MLRERSAAVDVPRLIPLLAKQKESRVPRDPDDLIPHERLGVHREQLITFDLALRDADVEQQNLVTLSPQCAGGIHQAGAAGESPRCNPARSFAVMDRVEAEVEGMLSRFREQITRVEVHISDENAGKPGSADKRCLMEARPTGLQPVAVTHLAATIDGAVSGAAGKLRNALKSTLGRRSDHKGGASIRKVDEQ